MKSYSEDHIFNDRDIQLYIRAKKLVEALDGFEHHAKVRCHELTRACSLLLGLDFQDGFYGFVDHSWLWTKPLKECRILTPRIGMPNIIDCYAVGSLPIVRLVDCSQSSLPHVGWAYRPGEERKDIDMHFVHDLVLFMKMHVRDK